MEYPIWVQILIAMFAIFGVYSVLRIFAELFFSAENIGIAVHVRSEADVILLEGLLREASDTGVVRKKQPITVLFYPGVMHCAFDGDGVPIPRVGELLARYRANYCPVE